MADCVATITPPSPPPLPCPTFFFVDASGKSDGDTDITTTDPWSASFSSTAPFLKPDYTHKNRRSAFAPRGRNAVFRTAQVSRRLISCRATHQVQASLYYANSGLFFCVKPPNMSHIYADC